MPTPPTNPKKPNTSGFFKELLSALDPRNLTRAQKADLIFDAMAYTVLLALIVKLETWMVFTGFLGVTALSFWSFNVTRPRR